MNSTLEQLRQLALKIAASDQETTPLQNYGSSPILATQADIIQLLEQASEVYMRDPHLGRGLAALAWAAVQNTNDSLLRARTALTYGRMLVRTEYPDAALNILQEARNAWTELGDEEQVAMSDWQIGVVWYLQNRYPKAVDILISAAGRLKAAGNHRDAACCRHDLTVTLNYQGKSHLAGEYIQSAIIFFQEIGDKVELARCYTADASRLQWLGHFEQALEKIAIALPILEKENLPLEQGIAHYTVAFMYMQRDTFSEAIGNTRQARRFFEQVRFARRIAHCENLLGGAYLRSLRPNEAIPHLETAAAFYAQHNLPVDLARGKANLGITHALLGNLALARQYLLAAIPLFEAANETHSVANCQTQLGMVLYREGRSEEALSYLEIAWYTWQQLDRPLFAAQCAMNLSLTCQLLNQWDKALDWLKAAFECYEAVNSTVGIIRAQLEMSRLYTKKGQLEIASGIAKNAVTMAQTNQADVAFCEQRLGDISAIQGDWEKATHHYANSKKVYTEIGMRINSLESSIAQGDSLRRTNPSIAQEILDAAQIKAVEWHLPDLAWRAARALAELARDEQDWIAELAHLEAAGRWLAAVRRRISQPNLAYSYFSDRLHLLERGLDVALQLNRPESAIFFNDETRSQCLAVQLERLPSLPAVSGDYETHLTAQRRDLMVELNMLERELSAQASIGQAFTSTSHHANLMRRHQETAIAYEEICTQLERASLRSQLEPGDISPVNIKQLQATGFHYLSFHMQNSKLVIFNITPESITMSARALSSLDRMALKTCASPNLQERSLVYGLPNAPLGNPDLSRQWRQRLFNLLIPQEARTRLTLDQPLVIVPHDSLYSLPFHTLQDPNGRLLIELTSITYAPSLALLQTLARQTGNSKQKDAALIIGIRNFNGRHPDLPYARQESATVAKNLSFPSILLLDDDATEVSLSGRFKKKGETNRYRLIHLATHGFSDAQFGRLAGIALSDRDLRLNDLQSLRLTAPLVVLSACETGLGIGQNEGGAGGVAGVFFALGARTVVATLWPAYDPTTQKIIERFYKLLPSSHSPVIALAKAQRDFIDLPLYYWAHLACFGVP
ncbi:MAG: CHAT domain-containing protein [Anaerolineales bacterium]|nr:CHAT domain-containing protein [Anaerolineales bacterium]